MSGGGGRKEGLLPPQLLGNRLISGTRRGCGSPGVVTIVGELISQARSWGPRGRQAWRLEAHAGSSTPPTSTCYSGLSKGAHLGRCEVQKQSRRKKWSPAADHPGSERQLCYPRAGQAPFPARQGGTKLWPDTSDVPGMLWKLSGPGAFWSRAYATPGAMIQAVDPGGKLSGSSALLALEKGAEAETG